MARAKSENTLSERDVRLREVGERRLEKLKEQEERIRRHLETERGKNDHQALRYLLHQIEVERNDLFHNLKDPMYIPLPGKPQRGRRRIQSVERPTVPGQRAGGPAPQPTKYAIPRPVPGTDLPAFSSKYQRREEREEGGQGGRSWTSAPYVEVALPIDGADKIIAALRRFAQKDERSIVRDWAKTKFGSISEARSALLEGARVSADPEVWRALLAQTRNAAEFHSLPDDVLREAMEPGATGPTSRVRRAALTVHQKYWVDQTAKAIKDSAPADTDKDTLDRRLRAGLKSFHTAVNSGKHTNPQFPYLTSEREVVDLQSVVEQVKAFLDDPDDERYVKDKDDDRKRHRVTVLQRELGKALPRRRVENERRRWAGKPYFQGTMTKRRQASLVWDTREEVNGLSLAVPIGGFPSIDPERYIYQDGTSLLSDYQLASAKTNRGKACAVLKLKPKHDFLRWYAKHVENHNPDAPLERRCVHNTTQFVVVDPDGPNPRLFIRPVFKFYEPNKTIADCHARWSKPQCRYLIGIDRGINYVLRAVVVDTHEKKVVEDIAIAGKKHEWRAIREEIAYHQRMRDIALNEGAHRSVVAKHVRALALARKKDRALGRFETVEAVARLVEQCEQKYGSGNYCFVLEDLAVGRMNLKRNNRVKHMAAVSDALINQMRKRGYAYHRQGDVDGVRFEGAWYTSQVSPFGWWAKRDEVEAAWNKDKTRPIGRRVGKYYENPPEDGEGNKPELYRRGRLARPRDADGRPYGRMRFLVEIGDELPEAPRRWNWGGELFWDPHTTTFKDREFPHGVVLDADFVGAFNIALRPLVNDGQGKGFTANRMAEGHALLNPEYEIECPIPVYAFEEVDGDPRGALRRLVL
jgi:hypothetical protein